MADSRIGDLINDLIEREQWENARLVIERELEREPENHWLITQLGETYYEQQQYKKALHYLLKSREIVPDCPLTLWHLAGTLDALDYPNGAMRIYSWLLRSDRTAKDDPCWESAEWSESLKTDCVFRMGICFQHLGKRKNADTAFQQYVELLKSGVEGSYSFDETLRHIGPLQNGKSKTTAELLRKAADWVRTPASKTAKSTGLPNLDPKKLRELQEA